MRQFVINKLLRNILADEGLIARIDKLAEDISIIQFLATHHLHKRSMEIILTEDPVQIRAEFDRPASHYMFKNDFFAVKGNTVNPVADTEFIQWMANQ